MMKKGKLMKAWKDNNENDEDIKRCEQKPRMMPVNYERYKWGEKAHVVCTDEEKEEKNNWSKKIIL